MTLAISLDLEPMESEPVDELPTGREWLFEPKWDGFRALGFRDDDVFHLRSRNQKPLNRYFPELVEAMLTVPVPRFVLDGEIVIRKQSFEMLQLRLHPAERRIAQLAAEHPATFVAFDLLTDDRGRSLLHQPFAARRAALEAFFEVTGKSHALILSRATRSRAHALKWLRGERRGLDGIMAKPLDQPYRPGKRAMLKHKLWRSVDCVLAGLYWKPGTRQVDSLLFGLYDTDGLLHYVGRSRVTRKANEVRRMVEPLLGGAGFSGRAPGGKSRWSQREREAVPLRPQRVAELSADHITDQRFRHGARLIRWRDDKKPKSCTLDQLAGISDSAQATVMWRR